MAVYCGVCGDRLSDALDNWGSYMAAPTFFGWSGSKTDHGVLIPDTCQACGTLLREAIAKAATEIAAKHQLRLAKLVKEVEEQKEREKRLQQEKAEFERAWWEERRGKENGCLSG